MNYRGFDIQYLQYRNKFSGWVVKEPIYIEKNVYYKTSSSCVRGLKRVVDRWLKGGDK